MLQMNLYNIFIIFNIVVMTVFSKNIDIRAGLEEPIPQSVGLKFFTEINNLNDEDCAVDIYPDECCLYSDDDKCDIIEIMGGASDVITGGATKTFTMVAPLLDAYQRRGYCTLYIDSKPASKVQPTMRDTVKIKFDTVLKETSLTTNAQFCKRIDEDPLNDCNPVDCDNYYNGKRSHFSGRKRRCIKVPACFSNKNLKTIYNPVSNKCDGKSTLDKNDINYIKELTLNPTRRVTKEVLILQVRTDSDTTTLQSNISYDETDADGTSNVVYKNRPTDLKITDLKVLTQQQEAEAKSKAKGEVKAKLKAKDVIKNKIMTVPKAKVKAKAEKAKTAFCKAKAEVLRVKNLGKILKYLKYNKYTVMVLCGVSVMQCCLICTMVYCMTKNCLCGKRKQVYHSYFNDRNDASITTPLIVTSNINTETTECQYTSESSNYIEKKIKCYKACQKDRINNMKLSMSDDIISKYATRQNWLRLPRSEMIPEAKKDKYFKITKKNRSDYKSSSDMKVNFESNYQGRQSKVRRIIAKEENNTESNEKQSNDSSERQIYCHNYNIDNNSRASATTIQNNSITGISGVEGQKKNKTGSIEKSAQASFSNDSMDEFLSEKGILCMDDIASKCSNTSLSNATKSAPSNQSSKTSKNNVVKNIMNLIPKKVKGPSSDPGIKKSSNNLDLELLYVSRLSFASSFETDVGKDVKRIKGSTG